MQIIATRINHAHAVLAAAFGLFSLVVVVIATGADADILKSAFNIRDNQELGGVIRGIDRLVEPAKTAAFAVAPLGAIAGAASLAIGNRRGVALGVTALGGAILVAAVKPVMA